MGAFLTYALNKDGELTYVDAVANGAACECRCPHCNSPLYAKNGGEERQHHFAHAQGHECEGAYESSLHLLAKEVLQETGCIMLPPNKPGFPSGLVRLRNIEVEKFDQRYHIKPDLEGVMNNGERLLVEFLVSHKVNREKRKVIVDNRLKCIEIDINYLALKKEELRRFLTESFEDRKWIVELPPPKPKRDDISSSSGRKPIYDFTRNLLKEVFDKRTLRINPYNRGLHFDLKEHGYDTCEVGARFRGFKTDLLLYRSQKENKGYIAICIRGKRRSEFIKRPKDLRIIDIILKTDLKEDYITKHFLPGLLAQDYAVAIDYYEFH